MDNKRIFPRMDVNIACELHPLNSPFSTCPSPTGYHGVVMNMSGGGLSFACTTDFPIDTWLTFDFELDGRPFHIKARTTWVCALDDRQLYGCQFDDFHVMEHLNCAFNLL